MQSITKRASFILALTMLASSLISCGGESGNTNDTTAAQQGDTTSAAAVDSIKEKYGSYNYDGYTLKILGNDPGGHFYKKINEEANEIWYAEATGDIVSDAIYERNRKTEDLLGIKIEPVWGGKDQSSYVDYARSSIMAEDKNFDLMLGSLSYDINLAAEGYLIDLNTIDTLDTSNPWWDQSIIENYTMPGNRIYTLAGHYNSFDDYAVADIFYNKKVVEEYTDQDPVQLVRDGKWTIDAMMGMTKNFTADLDNNSVMNELDNWGLMDNAGVVEHLHWGFDITDVEREGDNYRITLGDERVVNAMDKLYNVVINSGNIWMGENSLCMTAFKEDRCMFYYEMLGCLNQLRDMDTDFGLLPLPKLDEKQENYTSSVNPVWCTALSVPKTVSDVARVGVIMEVLSAYSTDTVNATLYELMLGAKLVRDDATVEMLEIILDSKVYDLGALTPVLKNTSGFFKLLAPGSGFNYASGYASIKTATEEGLADFIETFENME